VPTTATRPSHVDIYRNGAIPWDQAAAAGVLDLHVAGTSAVPPLAAANLAVQRQFREMGPKSQPANSLRPWVNRFKCRFS
jgi:hypothetical protein